MVFDVECAINKTLYYLEFLGNSARASQIIYFLIFFPNRCYRKNLVVISDYNSRETSQEINEQKSSQKLQFFFT